MSERRTVPVWRRSDTDESGLSWNTTIETLRSLSGCRVTLFAPGPALHTSHVFARGELSEHVQADPDKAIFAIDSAGLVLVRNQFLRSRRHAVDDIYFWVDIETTKGAFRLQDENSS